MINRVYGRTFLHLPIRLNPFFCEAISKRTVYKQYYPMAFNNHGAYWIADVEKVNNPTLASRCLPVEKP